MILKSGKNVQVLSPGYIMSPANMILYFHYGKSCLGVLIGDTVWAKVKKYRPEFGKELFPGAENGQYCYQVFCQEKNVCGECVFNGRTGGAVVAYNAQLGQWLEIKGGNSPGDVFSLTEDGFYFYSSSLLDTRQAKQKGKLQFMEYDGSMEGEMHPKPAKSDK